MYNKAGRAELFDEIRTLPVRERIWRGLSTAKPELRHAILNLLTEEQLSICDHEASLAYLRRSVKLRGEPIEDFKQIAFVIGNKRRDLGGALFREHVRFRLLRYLKSLYRVRARETVLVEPKHLPEAPAAALITNKRTGMTDTERSVLDLRVDGMKQQDIATALGKTQSTVSRILEKAEEKIFRLAA